MPTRHNFTCEIGPRRRPKCEAAGRSHKVTFEDGGEMPVFSCAETSFSTTYQNMNRLMLMFCKMPIPTMEVIMEVPP